MNNLNESLGDCLIMNNLAFKSGKSGFVSCKIVVLSVVDLLVKLITTENYSKTDQSITDLL